MSDIGFAAAACKLGRAIWKARVRAYDLACIDWDDLDATTRHLYVQQAGDILVANRPVSTLPAPTPLFDAFVAQARADFPRIVK
jgi:hypothetical protein